MNPTQYLVLVVLGAASALLAVWFVPRARRTVWFEAVLWVGTGLVATLGALLGVAAASGLAILRGLTALTFQDLPLIPALLGALGGAFLLTVPLWLMNRFEPSEDPAESDGERAAED